MIVYRINDETYESIKFLKDAHPNLIFPLTRDGLILAGITVEEVEDEEETEENE